MSKNSNIENTSAKEQRQSSLAKSYIVYSRYKRKILSRYSKAIRYLSVMTLFLLIFIFLFSVSRVLQSNQVFQIANAFLFTPEDVTQEFKGRTNILILGKSDADINTPDLTDTMIFASVKTSDPQSIVMLSIPRDIWIPEIEDKVNAAYRVGNRSATGGGLKLAKSSIEKIVGQPIHYAIAIDSSNLSELIDIIGGVDVEVEKTFTDKRFPVPGKENDDCDGDPEYLCRYESITFEKGLTHMDGETALKFSRSRHSEDLEEGTDFARSARQQKVLGSIKDKVLSAETITSFSKMSELYNLSKQSIETDMSKVEIAYLARRVIQSSRRITQTVLAEELLVNPAPSFEYNYLYVFIPKNEDWSEVHQWVEELF